MIQYIDVNEIHEIPGIEKYLDYKFQFQCFSFEDNLKNFSCQTVTGLVLKIEICSDETLIFHEEKLTDLVTEPGIKFFQWTVTDLHDNDIAWYVYRPLVGDHHKNFEL